MTKSGIRLCIELGVPTERRASDWPQSVNSGHGGSGCGLISVVTKALTTSRELEYFTPANSLLRNLVLPAAWETRK